MADNDDDPAIFRVFTDKITFLLIAMGSAAFVVTAYHLIAICLCGYHHVSNQNQAEQERRRQRRLVAGATQTASIDGSRTTSVPHLIPAHTYHKKKKGDDVEGGGDEDGTCAVCLGDFEEGEELKTLPECLHSFHVQCIDMWLYSHSSCPICRTDATPSPAMLGDLPGSGELNAHHSIDMMQIGRVENEPVQR